MFCRNCGKEIMDNEDILKKIQLTLTYEVGNKIFNSSMERMKIKE